MEHMQVAVFVGLLDFSDLVGDSSVVEALKIETIPVVCGGGRSCGETGALPGFESFQDSSSRAQMVEQGWVFLPFFHGQDFRVEFG